MATAKQLAWRKKFAAMARAGTLRKASAKAVRKVTKRKPNPAPAKKTVAKKVTRVSQTTKTKPTKRLVARRKATLLAPPGYFANPAKTATRGYWSVTDMHTKTHVATFINKARAVQYGEAYAKSTGHQVGVSPA